MSLYQGARMRERERAYSLKKFGLWAIKTLMQGAHEKGMINERRSWILFSAGREE